MKLLIRVLKKMDFPIVLSILVFVLLADGLLLYLLARRGKAADEKNETLAVIDDQFERLLALVRDESHRSRGEAGSNAREAREELGQGLQRLRDQIVHQQVSSREADDLRFERLATKVEERLKALQGDNANQIDQMRKLVGEKLDATLEQRLGQQFSKVAESLDKVHKGVGEMQAIAHEVGGLKAILGNVKRRGVWGEQQLASIIEDVLTPDQYAINVATIPDSNDRVEFAVRLPGAEGREVVWLPIDAKFPLEDYQRLVTAQSAGDAAAVEVAGKALETRVRQEARSISEKYVSPPHTTDFAIMFVPIESLYAEILRRPGLADAIQRERRVILAGPMTFTALLNSLQVGFRTLAIERRTSEIRQLLGAVKSEFGKFEAVLEKLRKKLGEANDTIDTAQRRTRVMGRTLRDVEAIEGVGIDGGMDGDVDEDGSAD